MRNGLTTATGAHLVMEDSPELPNVITDGVLVATGLETMISLKGKNITRLKAPYSGDCADEIEDPEVKTLYPDNFKYSAKSCTAFCYAVNTNEACGCYEPSEVGGIVFEQYDELSEVFTRCDTKNSTISQCIQGVRDDFDNCGCKSECTDTTYTVMIPIYKASLYFSIYSINYLLDLF